MMINSQVARLGRSGTFGKEAVHFSPGPAEYGRGPSVRLDPVDGRCALYAVNSALQEIRGPVSQ
jgi:hypothetical protein